MLNEARERLRALGESRRGETINLYRARIAEVKSIREHCELEGIRRYRERLEHYAYELIRDNLWLIRPELSSYVISDEERDTIASKAASALGVDAFATEPTQTTRTRKNASSTFVISSPSKDSPEAMYVVGLKPPDDPIDIDDYRELENDILELGEWIERTTGRGRAVKIRGFLIGRWPPRETPTSAKQKQLLEQLEETEETGHCDAIEALELGELMERASTIHRDGVLALERGRTKYEQSKKNAKTNQASPTQETIRKQS